MSWETIRDQILSDAGDMTVLNGYNLNWETGLRHDIGLPHDGPVSFFLEVPPGQSFEETRRNQTGASANERRVDRTIWMVARAKIPTITNIVEDVIYLNDQILEKALADIKQMFNGVISDDYCVEGVTAIEYTRAMKRAVASPDVYYPWELLVTYTFTYTENRNL